jgi:quinohemoprotein ethanol dehydrogenase
MPHVDSARRCFPDIARHASKTARLAQFAAAFGLSLMVSCGIALAQTSPKASADHIKAVTSAVDGAMVRANTATSDDWPTIGLDYAETRFSKLHMINSDNVKMLWGERREHGTMGAVQRLPMELPHVATLSF